MRQILSAIGRQWRNVRNPLRAVSSTSVDLNDLLGRRPVNLDTPQLQRFLAGKRVLVTGAGGSIGSEICRQTLKFFPERLVMLDRGENALFEIDRELRQRWVGADVCPTIADLGDVERINRIFETEQPQVVFHAGAHKHVPMMELNPGEAVKVNVLGTKTIADASRACGVSAFVMISTDKAVNPTSVMGATKRVAELYVQSLNAEGSGQWAVGRNTEARHAEGRLAEGRVDQGRRSQGISAHCQMPNARCDTRFVAVRFGNVLGSNGSVVPIFMKQITDGGPVTVTHPDMRRYFMTIPEASQLVMQAGSIGQGGEIFVLDMGEQVRIVDLAHELIRRAGLKVGRDIEVVFTGVRPGEKLYEELAGDDEQTRPTNHPKIKVWQLPVASGEQVGAMVDELQSVVNGPREAVLAALCNAVPEYQPAGVQRTKISVQSAPLKLSTHRAA